MSGESELYRVQSSAIGMPTAKDDGRRIKDEGAKSRGHGAKSTEYKVRSTELVCST